MNDDSFSVLARKIRSKKLNKEDIENLKKEAIESKIERNRRQKKAIEIQRIIRGYLARKKFKILEEKMNINTIIDYLYEKKLKRIHKHSSRIITYFLFKYIERQRKIKNKLINEFKIHCSDLIKAFLRGIILRKQIKGQLELIRRNKKILSPYFLSFKTRLMLKCNTIQNILADIANIKFLLQDEKEQNQNEESKQGINELKLKLRKKYNEFYLIFYQNKMTCEWVDEERTQDPWLKKYHKILNGEETSYLKKNNGENINDITNNNNGVDNNKKTKKSENDISDINNNKFNDYDYSQNDNNYDNNYNEEYSNSNNNNMNKTPQMYKEDERPIKPMKNNNFINSENPFGLSEKGFPQDHKYNNYIGNNNQKKLTNPKSKIKRNTTNNQKKIPNQNINNDIPSSFSHLLNQNEEESKSDLQYKENQNKNNINDNQYNYDERPIGVKKIDYKAMFAEGQYFEGDAFGGMNQEININQNQKKIIKNKNSPRKKPVYDARKAIEEAKLREAKEGKKEKTSAFREFVKEMKKISAEEKAGQAQTNENNQNIINNNNNSNNNIPKIKKYGRDDLPIKKNNYIDDNLNYNNNEGQEPQEPKAKKIPIRGRNMETKDQIMRRKLHELERSPPPILNIKGIKSKIECWGPSNDVKRKRISQYNIEKENKKARNTKNNKSTYQIESKDNINVQSINKKSIEVNQSKNVTQIDPKKIEEKAQKIAGKKLARIENQINRIESEFNLDSYFKDKEKRMMEFGRIPYIKKEYNYVKKYSNEVYKSLVTHLMAQYQDLK
jgi:hypothetical protein